MKTRDLTNTAKIEHEDEQEYAEDVDYADDADDTEDEEPPDPRSDQPADWHVIIAKKGFVFDCKYHSESIARGMLQHYTKNGYTVTLTHEPNRIKSKDTQKAWIDNSHNVDSTNSADTTQISPKEPSARDFEKSVCDAIRRCRIAEKWSCQELIEKIKERRLDDALSIKSGSGYSRLETGNVKLSLQHIFALATLFEIAPSELISMAERAERAESMRS